jgi:hypothetical protein
MAALVHEQTASRAPLQQSARRAERLDALAWEKDKHFHGSPMSNNAGPEHGDHGYPTGMMVWLLRAEALAILAASTALFFLLGGDLLIFAVLFFAPDLSFLGYGAGRKVGAVLYNTVHSYALHSVLAVAGVLSGHEILWQVALIFVAHAAFDRSLGYGLKYFAGFRYTHLGTIGASGN